MVQRDDILVRWDLSPRLVVVKALSTEITIQDLHDTLRELEQRPSNMIYPHIISTAGKEPLGGNVFVGLTSTLQNAQLSFESRYDRVCSGLSDTTGTPDTIIFTDNNAAFISNGVKRGATITNFDDQSFACVVDILSEKQIRHEPLHDGYTNCWNVGDSYKIHNEIQCKVSGGNLTAIDEYGNELDAISPTAFIQILKTGSSSATDRNSQDIEYASFDGGVSVNLSSPYSGTSFPVGTKRQPVNNFSDALDILNYRGFSKIYLGSASRETFIIDSGLDFENICFCGESPEKTQIEIMDSTNVYGCSFSCVTISGILDGYCTIADSVINNIILFSGCINHSGLCGLISLGDNIQSSIIDCFDYIAGSDSPIIDMGGSGQALVLSNYSGNIGIINKTGNDSISIGLDSGCVALGSTVTNGEIIISGIGALIDNSVGANVDSTNLIEGIKIQKIAYNDEICLDTIDGTPGTVFGKNGLPTLPVNSITDAVDLGLTGGFRKINFRRGSVYLNQNLENWVITGNGHSLLQFNGYDISGGSFYNLTLSDTIGTDTVPSYETDLFGFNCVLADGLENLRGSFRNSILFGKITVRSNAGLLLDKLSVDELSTFGLPTIDVNGSQLTVQGLDGYLVIENVNSVDSCAIISMNSGHVIIDKSCTNGDIIVRGNGTVVNDGGSNLVIVGTISVSEIASETFKKLLPFVL